MSDGNIVLFQIFNQWQDSLAILTAIFHYIRRTKFPSCCCVSMQRNHTLELLSFKFISNKKVKSPFKNHSAQYKFKNVSALLHITYFFWVNVWLQSMSFVLSIFFSPSRCFRFIYVGLCTCLQYYLKILDRILEKALLHSYVYRKFLPRSNQRSYQRLLKEALCTDFF